MTTKLAVIGAGAKAAALAAKAQSLSYWNRGDFEITVFEKNRVGCNWQGGHGYTDGVQDLCTTIARDVGFPYQHDDIEVVEHMMANYSWPAYLVRAEEHTEWTVRGKDRPSHHAFHEYLNDVLERSKAEVLEETEVVGLKVDRKQWIVSARPTGSRAKDFGPYDGVVVTGPGPAKATFGGFSDSRFFNGEDVWTRLPDLKAAIEACEERIVIVGGGGTAAAIAAWLISAGYGDREIKFVARQATLFTRTANYLEDRVFQDETIWDQLGPDERRQFVDRLTRSVVWEAVSDRLSQAQHITVQPGRAKSVAETDDGDGTTLTVFVEPSLPDADTVEIEASVVIDATGFDAWWFIDLLPASYRKASRKRLEKLANDVDYHLRFPWKRLPSLFVPTISFAAGPGFSSLMTLGLMADRVLDYYRPVSARRL